jgi:hypothetical protein
MHSTLEQIETIISKAGDYAQTKFTIYKLSAAKKLIAASTSILSILVVLIFGWLAILFCSIGLALGIGIYIQHPFAGFFIVGSFYFLVGIILLLFRKKILIDPLRKLWWNQANKAN